MSDSLEGPGSERWIEPFGAFLVGEQFLSKSQLQRASRLVGALDTRLGWLAVALGYMSARDVYAVLSKAQDRHGLFGELAVQLGVLTAAQVCELLTLQGSPFQLFVHCLLLTDEVDGCALRELLCQFLEREGLAPAWESEPSTEASAPGQPLPGLRDARLWRKLEEIPALATLPSVIPHLLNLLEQEDASTDDVAEVIGHDPALATQLLRVASSEDEPGQPRSSIASVRQAIRSLGEGIVRQVVLAATVMNVFDERSLPAARALWEHSLRTAVWCRALRSTMGLREDPFLHGLLHEIGRLVLLQCFPRECCQADELAQGDATREQAQRQIFGTTQADVGAYMCRCWSLPESIGQAALHHATPTVLLRQAADLLPTTRVVHAACRLAEAAGEAGAPFLDAAFQEFHSLDLDLIADLSPEVDRQTRELIARFIGS